MLRRVIRRSNAGRRLAPSFFKGLFMKVQPYLFFEGRCEEALEFYKKTLGATISAVMRYRDNPEPAYNPPGSDEKVMHCDFTIGQTQLMASDGNCSGKPTFGGVSLSIEAKDAADAKRLFDVLADGGQVQMPMNKTFFSPAFGIVQDRFGVSWMLIAPEGSA